MSPNDISADDLLKILGSYHDQKVTDHLYAFGSMLITEIGQRADRIESKANLVIGWSTAILAFLFTQLDKLRSSGRMLELLSGLIALLAALALASAYRAHRSRGDWEWPSDIDWFRESELENEERIKKFHLQCLHGVLKMHQRITEEKGYWLLRAQRILVLAVVFLAAAIILKLISSLVAGFQF